MSVRALRKVLQEQESALNPHGASSADDQSDSPSDSPGPSFKNPFDLLNEHEEEHESSDIDTSPMVNHEVTEPSSKKNTVAKVSSASKNSKKKKKKKNKELSSSTDNVNSLDTILEDLSLGANSSSGQDHPSKHKPENPNGTRPAKGSTMPPVLHVDPRFLSAENELRRIFGSKVVSSFERSNQPGSSRQSRPGRRGGHAHRKTILVTPSDHWPRWDGSLSMELLENRDGCNYFRYVHSSSYSQAQRQFEAAKATHDLNGIASILLHHPYHIDSLITLADYFKFSGELQMSADATAKALYASECAWHPSFDPLHGSSRLDHRHTANKPVFNALFAHMKNMDRRGCHRSALEICKLLLSLDPDDPTGSLFCVDYFAVRAGEYAWLERFAEEYERGGSLWLYPNFAYSLAVCRFYLEREAGPGGGGGRAAAGELMKQAVMLHPAVLKKLVAKVPLKEAAWTKIVGHGFFRSDQTGSESLDHLVDIYVERSYIIWRLPDLHNFLKDTALSVMETSRSDAKDWECVRNEAFGSDNNEYSHLMVSDFSDSTATIPPENLQNFMADPRAAAEMQQQAENQENRPGVARAPRDVANRNALAVLFESMLPWMDYGPREDNDGPDQENGVAPDHNG